MANEKGAEGGGRLFVRQPDGRTGRLVMGTGVESGVRRIGFIPDADENECAEAITPGVACACRIDFEAIRVDAGFEGRGSGS